MFWAIGAVVGIFLAFCIGFIAGMTSEDNTLLKEGFRVKRSAVAEVGNGRMWIERRNENGTWRSVAPIEKGAD